jgi:hypothetical protein
LLTAHPQSLADAYGRPVTGMQLETLRNMQLITGERN